MSPVANSPVLISAAELAAELAVAIGSVEAADVVVDAAAGTGGDVTDDASRRVPVVLDARWNLVGRDGREEFEEGHVPWARFVAMHGGLAASAGAGGRHPLPTPADFQAAMRQAGVDDGPVVVMDGGAPLAAARLWWLLTDAGHDDVRVLDGGFAAWRAAGGAVATGTSPAVSPSTWTARPGRRRTADIDTVAALAASLASAGSADVGPGEPLGSRAAGSGSGTGRGVDEPRSSGADEPGGSGAGDPEGDRVGDAGATGDAESPGGSVRRIVDVRAGERFRGEHEPIDPVAGHIPGAINVESSASFRDGLFRPPAELAAHFDAAGVDAEAIVYCGSGITACQTLLAMAVAGREPATLFAGSWSAWVAAGDRPVAAGG